MGPAPAAIPQLRSARAWLAAFMAEGGTIFAADGEAWLQFSTYPWNPRMGELTEQLERKWKRRVGRLARQVLGLDPLTA